MAGSYGKIVSRLVPCLVLAGFAIFLLKPFRTGWTQSATDFPNYYTAAVALREGKPLHDYYDWTWFQRQMNYAGIERQLGAYAAQTPLTMLPMAAFAGQAPQTAKRIWLATSLALLAATIAMLARVTGMRWHSIALLALCGFGSLTTNFVYGQYYVFLLFLITAIFYWLERNRAAPAGVLAGIAFGLKLYTGPLLLYFAVKRKWRCALGMVVGLAGMAVIAIVLFGWGDVSQYVSRVLPRSLEGSSIDPYNAGNPTLSALLRRMLMAEPELNPRPPLNAPWLFFFLFGAVQLGLLTFCALGIVWNRSSGLRREFGWLIVTLLALSTSVGSYTYILLLLPVVLLLKDAAAWEKALLAGCYILLNNRLPWTPLFPKVWLLLLLFALAGRHALRAVPPRWAAAAALSVVLVSLGRAQLRMADYAAEPGRRYPQIAVEREELLSSYPAVSRSGLFFQCMGPERYQLCWLHEGRTEALSFEGHALHPVCPGGAEIWFELVANRKSTMMRFDPATRRAAPLPPPAGSLAVEPLASPDGKWTVSTRGAEGSRRLWLENAATGKGRMLAGGNCDNAHPAWELDSSAVIFSSDCGRAYGLPALYRAPVSEDRAR